MNLDDLPVRNGFRQRGQEMTRIETFTDAAFAISASLMVISVSDIPGSWHDLKLALQGIPAFAMAMIIMMVFWYGHHIWSRRYGLDDQPTVWLSGTLILTVLVYVYPLKFMTNSFISWVSGGNVTAPAEIRSAQELYSLFAVYTGGFTIMSVIILLLYGHAWRLRDMLELNPVEKLHTRFELISWSIMAGIGLLSTLLALILPPSGILWPGIVLASLIVAMPAFGQWSAGKMRQFQNPLPENATKQSMTVSQ